MYVGSGCMSTAAFACTFVQVAYLQLRLHVRLLRLHIATCACMYVGDRMFDDTFARAMVLIACWKVHVHWCRLDVGSCVCMYSGENGMFVGTFVSTVVQIGCCELRWHVFWWRWHV